MQNGGAQETIWEVAAPRELVEAASRGQGGRGLVPAGSGELELEEAPKHEDWPWRCGSLAICHLTESPSGLTRKPEVTGSGNALPPWRAPVPELCREGWRVVVRMGESVHGHASVAAWQGQGGAVGISLGLPCVHILCTLAS